VQHDVVAFGDDESMLVAQTAGRGFDQVEQPLAPGRDMRTVL
jgi:hypothetical protein